MGKALRECGGEDGAWFGEGSGKGEAGRTHRGCDYWRRGVAAVGLEAFGDGMAVMLR